MPPRREKATLLGDALRAVARMSALRERRASRAAAASNMPYDRFVEMVAKLRRAGLVDEQEPLRLTPLGREALKRFDAWREVVRYVEDGLGETPLVSEGAAPLPFRASGLSPGASLPPQAGPIPRSDPRPDTGSTPPSIPPTHPSQPRAAGSGVLASAGPVPMVTDLSKRRDAALKEILDATELIDIARRSIYGVPGLFLDRIELAVSRLKMLERVKEQEPASVRAPGTVAFSPAPPDLFEPSARTKKQPRSSRTG